MSGEIKGTTGNVYFQTSAAGVSDNGIGFTLNHTNTAASAIGRSFLMTSTIVAAANNDVLVGMDLANSFTSGAFTGLKQVSLRANRDIYINNSAYGFVITDRGLGTARRMVLTNNVISWEAY